MLNGARPPSGTLIDVGDTTIDCGASVPVCTTICGLFVVASSLLKIACASVRTVARTTKETIFRPAASSLLTNCVTSSSYHLLLVLFTVALARMVAEAGRLFHVIPDSVQLVPVLVSATGTFCAADSLP